MRKNQYFVIITIIFIFISVFFSYNSIVLIDGISMEPALDDGNIVLIKKNISNIIFGDIVAIKFKEEIIIKRIVGLPNDIIEIKNGDIMRNGDIHPMFNMNNQNINFNKITVPEKSFFVLGDNLNKSLDSRFFEFISIEMIIGIKY